MSQSKRFSEPVKGAKAERCTCGHMRRYHHDIFDEWSTCSRCSGAAYFHDFTKAEKK